MLSVRAFLLTTAVCLAVAHGAFAQSTLKFPELSQEDLKNLDRYVLHGPGWAATWYYVPGGWPHPEPTTQVPGRWWDFNGPSVLYSVGSHTYDIWYYQKPHPEDGELKLLSKIQRVRVSNEGYEDVDAHPRVWRMYGPEFLGTQEFDY